MQQQTFRKMQNYLWKLTSACRIAPCTLHHQRVIMNIAPSYIPIQTFGRNWFCDLVQETVISKVTLIRYIPDIYHQHHQPNLKNFSCVEEYCTFSFVANYAFFCGEKLSQKSCLERKIAVCRRHVEKDHLMIELKFGDWFGNLELTSDEKMQVKTYKENTDVKECKISFSSAEMSFELIEFIWFSQLAWFSSTGCGQAWTSVFNLTASFCKSLALRDLSTNSGHLQFWATSARQQFGKRLKATINRSTSYTRITVFL